MLVCEVGEPRPLAIANARIVDPSRGLDFPGDLLMADGVHPSTPSAVSAPPACRTAPKSSTARGHVVAPGLIDIRAFVGEPGARISRDPRLAPARRRQPAALPPSSTMPDTTPVIDDPAHRRFRPSGARATPPIVNVQPMAALTKGLEGKRDDGDRPAQGAPAPSRFTDGRALDHQCAGDAARPHLCARFRRPRSCITRQTRTSSVEGVMNEGEFATRLGLHGIPTSRRRPSCWNATCCSSR